MSVSRPATTPPARDDGLSGQWLSLEEIAEIDLFKSSKRAFKLKLSTNFGVTPGQREPGIKAAVRRVYQPGEIICRAGEYGSTAFLLLEGTATSFVPESASPVPIAGRRTRAMRRLRRLFRRHSRSEREAAPDDADIGEVSRYASISCDRPPPPRTVRPGEVFGVDTCLNFYPREATVRAEEPCLVIEMLRSVLDSIREAGEGGAQIDADYRADAIRNQVHLNSLFRLLSAAQKDAVIATAELLTPESDAVRNSVLFTQGDAADAIYLVRSGTIKLSQGDVVLAYLGRGAAFGFEGLLQIGDTGTLRLQCVSHPSLFPPRDVGAGLTLGRSAACDVALPADNRAVGRTHCRLEDRGGDVYLIDLNSANFTLLNGERCREALVTAGDRITVVDYTFELTRAPRETAAAPAATRVVTAGGLDSFEIIKIPNATLQQLAQASERFAAAATIVARELAASLPQLPAEQALVNDLVELNLYNSQNTLLIDLDRCTRCDQCVRACASAHDGVARFTRDGPRVGNYLVTMACRSCTDPQCMIGCPVGSIRRQDSLEIRIEDWCIGCERCANQCPFGNINMVELGAKAAVAAAPAPAPPASGPIEIPSLRLRATVCDLCAGYDGPNCVYACPHDAAIRVNPAAFVALVDRSTRH
jgi:Fe-S-cluster-containing hydrogenase component 2/CRP-like cAMP-binding protein